MPTKRIQLRGISRTPSDRMSADGGLAESIGLEMNENELAVNVPATDVTRDIVGNDVLLDNANLEDVEIVYIHKTNDYTNYIAKNNTGIGLLDSVSPYFHAFYTFGTGECCKDIESMGNTLIILLANSQGENQRMEYVIFKDGAYVDLGEQIPTPDIEIVQTTVDLEEEDYEDCKTDLQAAWAISPEENAGMFSFLRMLCGYQFDPDEVITEQDIKYWNESQTNYFNGMLNKIVDSIYNYVTKHNLDNQTLSEPVFIRYAARLYDGSYTKQSAPILIDPMLFADEELVSTMRFHYDKLTGSVYDSLLKFTFVENNSPYYTTKKTEPYTLSFIIKNASEFANWKDIVSGVDIFASELIDRKRMKVLQIDDFNPDHLDSFNNNYYAASTFHLKPYTDKEMLEMISSHSIFYQIKKIEIDDYVNATTATPLDIDDYKVFYNENLVTLPTLSDDLVSSSHHVTVPSAIKVYNSRLMASGTKVKYMSGYPEPASRKYENDLPNEEWILRYYIHAGGWQSGSEIIVSKRYLVAPGPWLFYPDRNCYKADIIKISSSSDYYILTVDMFEDIHLNGACGFLGWGAEVNPNLPYTYENIDKPYRNRFNTLVQTEAFNPFVFTAEKEFTGKLIDIAVITKPLSTGQFGYSSLYVFTDEGLWGLGINSDGSLAAKDAISQDVALPGTVCQLDQAVVFTTKKGVMLLTGSDLRCISDKMHGRHYKLDDIVHNLLRSSTHVEKWGDLASMAHEDQPFMEYMQDARTAYDYVGRRLLFFSNAVERPAQPYIYVYMIETDSWHKVVLPEGYVFKHILNSYPDTLISMVRIETEEPEPEEVQDSEPQATEEQEPVTHRYAAVVSFSEARKQNQTESDRQKALLVTRPIDLDEVDVRKVLNRLYVRGQYDKQYVKMVLLGSMDGVRWQILQSFRGGSYKLFRVVLLSELLQTERISYLEAEYETRYASRLR